MSAPRATSTPVALLVMAVLAACGEEAARVGIPTAIPEAAATRSAVPAALTGTWEVAMRESELPDGSHEVGGGRGDEATAFRMEFHATGGRRDGPSITLEHDDEQTVVIPIGISDGRISIPEPVACRTLLYAVEGDRLTLEPAHGGCIRERTLPAILATRPWRRAG